MIESKNLTDYPEIMTVYDLGEYFDVSYPTALKWLKNNSFQEVKVNGSRIHYILRSSVEEYIKNNIVITSNQIHSPLAAVS